MGATTGTPNLLLFPPVLQMMCGMQDLMEALQHYEGAVWAWPPQSPQIQQNGGEKWEKP